MIRLTDCKIACKVNGIHKFEYFTVKDDKHITMTRCKTIQ